MSVPADSPVVMSSKLSDRLFWVMITPLGSEVDPDVYCKKATSHCPLKGVKKFLILCMKKKKISTQYS